MVYLGWGLEVMVCVPCVLRSVVRELVFWGQVLEYGDEETVWDGGVEEDCGGGGNELEKGGLRSYCVCGLSMVTES
jgi:hypothetical protein